MLPRQWEQFCREAGTGTTWTLAPETAGCSAGSTTCFALFLKIGEKPRRVSVSVGQQTDEALKAEIVQQLAAFDSN